jgi:hypothetical protein
LFEREDVFVENVKGFLPFSVEIIPKGAGSVVAISDSVWVDHRKNGEFIKFPEMLSLRRGPEKELNEAFHHQRTIGFSRMNSTGYHELFLGLFWLSFDVVSDSKLKNLVAKEC